MNSKFKKTLAVLVSIVVMLLMFPLFAFAQSNVLSDVLIEKTTEQFVSLPFISLTTEGLIWLVFWVILILYAVYSLILLYHWFRYAWNSLAVWPVMVVYFGVSFVLISTLIFSALALS